MLPTVARIFVSSTWIDLQPERQAVEDTINRMSEGKFIGMEYFGSRPETTERASLDEVDKADLYVGIIGGRYGSGITEKEYRRAHERGLPCFIYFKHETAIPAEWRESDARLDAFKQELRARHIITEPFSSPDELANSVMADLHRWFFDNHLSSQLTSASVGEIITGADDRRMRLEVGSEYGGVVHHGSAPQIRRHPTPVRPSLRPFQPFQGLLDRADETSAAVASLESLQPVEFCGQSGIGKTSLLRHLAYQTPAGKFPDGAVYLGQVGRRPSADLLQFIFDTFYESDVAFKPREAEMLNLLRDRRALILMDDVEIGSAEIEHVMNAAPDSAFLLASEERRLFSEGRVMTLPGLPADEARQLLERKLGRSLAPEERAPAQTICSMLQGHPLRLAQTAALAQERNLTLVKIAEQLQSVEAQSEDLGEAVIRYSLTSLSDGEKHALAAIAAFGGAPTSAQVLAEITGVSAIETTLESLLSRNLIESHEAGYRLPASALRTIEKEWDLTSWRERAMDYFITHAEGIRREPQRSREQSAAILSLLDWATRNGRSREATRFGKASEVALILGGQWEAWGQALRQIGEAAQAIDDSQSEAWALHQQGTRALCLGNSEAARALLTDALERRIKMGDHAAASVTRRNLDWLLPPVVPPQSQPPVNPVKRIYQRLPRLAKFVITAALLGGAALGGKEIYDYFTRPADVIRFNPDRLDFGEQRLGATGNSRIVTVTNTDNQPLRISNVAIGGLMPGDFRIAENGCAGATLAPQGVCSISIAFTPQAMGTRSAILTIDADARSDLPTLSLSGAAVPPPSPSPDANRVARISLTPGSLDFGSPEVGAREERSITLTNTGNAPLEVSRIATAGAHANDFSIVEENCTQAAILPNGACAIKISFTAGAAGERNANLAIASDAGLQNAPLGGTGVPRAPSLPVIEPRSLTFGEVDLGGSAEVQLIKITNPGESMLRIGGVSLRGDHTGDFEVVSTDCRGAALTQRSSCSIRIRFTPKAGGSRNANLIIADNTAAGEQIVPISGIGRAVVRLSITPRSLRFSGQPLMAPSAPRIVTVYSVGSGALSIRKVSVTGADAGDFTIAPPACSGASMAPGANCVINVHFVPRAAKFCEATLVITHNGPGGRSDVPLSGVGEAPAISLAPTELQFGEIETGTSGKPQSVKVINTGNAPLRISDLSFSDKGAFAVMKTNCANVTVNPNSNCDIEIGFSPQKTGAFNQSLQIKSNAPGSPHVVRLNGTGARSERPKLGVNPIILHFFADRSEVEPRKGVSLCYGVANTDSASINPEIGAVKPAENDCRVVEPKRTTIYTLTARGRDGQTDSRKLTIEVKPRFIPDPRPEQSTPPKILFFTARPTVVTPGKSAMLCYGVANASSAYISHGVGDVKLVERACRAVALKETTTFTLTAKSADGRSDRQTVTVRVEYPIK